MLRWVGEPSRGLTKNPTPKIVKPSWGKISQIISPWEIRDLKPHIRHLNTWNLAQRDESPQRFTVLYPPGVSKPCSPQRRCPLVPGSWWERPHGIKRQFDRELLEGHHPQGMAEIKTKTHLVFWWKQSVYLYCCFSLKGKLHIAIPE